MEVDSNSDKYLLYDEKSIYEENGFHIYFNDMNSRKLDDILSGLNIRVIYYIVDGNKYYTKSISDLEMVYTSEMNKENKIYYSLNGINIDEVFIVCSINELIKLDNLSFIY